MSAIHLFAASKALPTFSSLATDSNDEQSAQITAPITANTLALLIFYTSLYTLRLMTYPPVFSRTL